MYINLWHLNLSKQSTRDINHIMKGNKFDYIKMKIFYHKNTAIENLLQHKGKELIWYRNFCYNTTHLLLIWPVPKAVRRKA